MGILANSGSGASNAAAACNILQQKEHVFIFVFLFFLVIYGICRGKKRGYYNYYSFFFFLGVVVKSVV